MKKIVSDTSTLVKKLLESDYPGPEGQGFKNILKYIDTEMIPYCTVIESEEYLFPTITLEDIK